MMRLWRRLLAAVITAIGSIGVATAQTVMVTNAPPGSTIELVLNTNTIRTTTVGPGGDATVAVNLFASGGKTEMDVRVHVDVCGTLRRLLLVENGLQPPPRASTCDRKEIAGLFVVRPVTSLVIDVGTANPMMWLRQGPVPAEWFTQGPGAQAVRALRRPATGLVLLGGAGLVRFRDAVASACGNAPECAAPDFRSTYTVGAAYSVGRFFSAEASYMKPAKQTAAGGGDIFRFNNMLKTDVLVAAANVGVPVGAVRFYGQIGTNYHRATSSTTQTIDDVTATIDGVPQTAKGGTQTFEMKTRGWGWVFGGGIEAWMRPALAIYAQGGRIQLKGTDLGGGEGSIDERVTFIVAGIRVRVLR